MCIPVAVATGPEGSVYFADGGQVFRIGADGSFEHVAGRADSIGFDGDGGPAVDAGLQLISDLAVAPDGTLYILDSCNHRVRRVGADGVITTVAGSGPVCPEQGVRPLTRRDVRHDSRRRSASFHVMREPRCRSVRA